MTIIKVKRTMLKAAVVAGIATGLVGTLAVRDSLIKETKFSDSLTKQTNSRTKHSEMTPEMVQEMIYKGIARHDELTCGILSTITGAFFIGMAVQGLKVLKRHESLPPRV